MNGGIDHESYERHKGIKSEWGIEIREVEHSNHLKIVEEIMTTSDAVPS